MLALEHPDRSMSIPSSAVLGLVDGSTFQASKAATALPCWF